MRRQAHGLTPSSSLSSRGANPWSSSQDTSRSTRNSASPTSRAVWASSKGHAKQTAACFAITADLIDPGRIDIFERWESQEAVAAFRKRGPSNEQRAAMLSASVAEYDVADVRQLFAG